MLSKFVYNDANELLLIMVTSLFMASKIQEVCPIPMETLIDFIASDMFDEKTLHLKNSVFL